MKKLILLFSFMLSCMTTFAGVEIDGIVYEIDNDTKEAMVVKNNDSLRTGDIVIPSSITVDGIEYRMTSIGNDAFRGCVDATSVVIPNSVKSIGEYAFATCGFTSITIGNSVETIGTRAFAFNSRLTSVVIPKSVKSIDDLVFGEDNAMTTMIVEEGNSVYDSRENCNAIIETATNTLVEGCQASFIPSTVERIGNWAFCFRETLTKITIPESVVSIGDYAFSLSGLTDIVIPKSVKSIGKCAFEVCQQLASVTLTEGLETIGENAFSQCGFLSLDIPESVNSIGASAFAHCTNLQSVNLPSSITNIPDGIFAGCTKITTVVIPASVTSIGVYAFSNCNSITSIDIPKAVTNIGEAAFFNCSGLTTITIPEAVTSIGDYAFYGCQSLTDVTVGWSVPLSVPSNIFTNVTIANVCLWVPAGSNKKYSRAQVWRDFGTIKEVDPPAGIEAVSGSQVSDFKSRKYLHNGRVMIEKGGKRFTPAGQETR